MGHPRALLGVASEEMQLALARRIVAEGLSVRAVERAVRTTREPTRSRPSPATPPAHLVELEGRLRELLGTRVRIQDSRGRGKLVIEYDSREDFDRILEMLGG